MFWPSPQFYGKIWDLMRSRWIIIAVLYEFTYLYDCKKKCQDGFNLFVLYKQMLAAVDSQNTRIFIADYLLRDLLQMFLCMSFMCSLQSFFPEKAIV